MGSAEAVLVWATLTEEEYAPTQKHFLLPKLGPQGGKTSMGRYVDLELDINPPLTEEDVGVLYFAFKSSDYDFPSGGYPKFLGGYWRKPSFSLFCVLDFIDLYVNDGRSVRGIVREAGSIHGDRQGDRSGPYAYDCTWYPSLPWDDTRVPTRDMQQILVGMIRFLAYERAGVLSKEMGDRFSRMVLTLRGPDVHQKYLSLAHDHGDWWELVDLESLSECLSL